MTARHAPPVIPQPAPFDFGAMLDAVAWETTALGPRAGWPVALQSLLGLLRRSQRPQYVVWGPERRFFYNAAFLPVMGIKHPAGFGQPMEEVWPEVWEDIRPLVDAAIDAGVSHYLQDIPFVLRRHGFDELTYFSFSYTPVEDDAGRIAGLMCVLNERTQEVQALAERRTELERMHRLFNLTPGFIRVTEGPAHEHLLVNAAYERLVGHPRTDLIGRSVVDALPEVGEQGYVALLDRVHATGEPFQGRAMPLQLARHGRNDTIYVDFVHQPIHDASGQVVGIFTQGADVTDRVVAEASLRASEQALQEANSRKDRFLATLGHELRNPLAPIQTATEILRHMPGLDAQALGCVEVIARQAKQMTSLVEDLLDVSRIANGLITLRIGDVDANNVVLKALEQLRPKASERGHKLHVFLAPAAAMLRGDTHRLTQVVSNLLANAIRYTAPGGRIHLSVSTTADEVAIEVADNGEGIAPELMPNLFVPFAQEARSADRSQGGLGLGLTLVKSLVDAHGGRVEVESAGRGAGSRFRVVFPVVSPGPQQA